MPFQTNDTNFLNDWLTVGPMARLAGTTQARPHTTQLMGNDVALWRDEAGAVHASAEGRPLPVQTQYGYMWVCAGETPTRSLFALPEYVEPGRRIISCDGLGIAASGLRVVENFLDMGHFPYVHAGYLGEVPNTEVMPYTVSIDEETDEIWATECRFYQPKSSSIATTGQDVTYRYRVMQPLSTVLYKSSAPRPGEMDAIALFVQPVDEVRVIAYCLLVYFDDTSSDVELIAFQQTILAQDKPILENQVPKRMPLTTGTETPTRADATSVAYRRWLRAREVRYGALVR